MKNTLYFFTLLLLIPVHIYGGEILDEDELFADPSRIITTANLKHKEMIEREDIIRRIGFSSEVIGVTDFMNTRDKSLGGNRTSSFILGRFYLDGRLKKKTKYFANIEIKNSSLLPQGESSQGNDTEITAKESFIDFNIKDKAYFRVGKQILQWGRAFFWNPSDLINVEKNTFIKRIGSIEGAYGVKLHIPFGIKHNIYSFIDLDDVDTPRDIGSALKYEFILNRSEMAFSVWIKRRFNTVYAYDLSTRVFGIDTIVEASVSKGANTERVKEENGILIKDNSDDRWIPRLTLDIGRQYDFMNINNRLSVNLEFFYNHNGYTENIFGDEEKRLFLLSNNLYEPNYLSKYYIAIFTSFSKFIISDLSLTLNLIRNIVDRSSTILVGLNYRDMINDFSIGLNTYIFTGRKNSEYTLSNSIYNLQFTLGVMF